MGQDDLDARIQLYYAEQFQEDARLTTRSAQGRLEFERVHEILDARLGPGSRILDVGGATGVHAAALAARGHDVVLIDPVPEQVAQAAAYETFVARVGDARRLALEDDSFDAVLLFGPLYHLTAARDRAQSLGEALRVVRPGGWVFAAAIPRFARHAGLVLGAVAGSPDAAELADLLDSGTPPDGGRFPGGHFHTGEELESELVAAGLVDVGVCALEGLGGLALERTSEVDQEVHDAALLMARRFGDLPGLREISNHLMGVGRVPTAA